MPSAPLRPCTGSPRCPHSVGPDHPCPVHRPRSQAHGYSHDVTRIRGSKLQRLRRQLFSREPLCRPCATVGLTAIAVIRDHITPLAEGGTDADANIQPICQACSDAKSKQEAQRGRERVR